jgi:hypothetical protein
METRTQPIRVVLVAQKATRNDGDESLTGMISATLDLIGRARLGTLP